MIAMMGNDLNDVCCWLFGGLRWESPSGPAPPLALTPALSRPAGEGEERLRRSMREGLLFSGWAFRPLKRPLSRE